MIGPTPTNSSFADPCVGLEAYNDARPTPPPGFTRAHIALMILYLIASVVAAAFVIYNQRKFTLIGRSSYLTCLHIIAFAVGFCFFTVKLAELPMGCQLHATFLIVNVSLSFTVFIIRALREWNRAQYAHLAIRYDRGFAQIDPEGSIDSTKSVTAGLERHNICEKLILVLWDVIYVSDATATRALHTETTLTPKGTNLSGARSAEAEEKLRLYSFLDKSSAVAALFFFLFFPGMLALIPYFLTSKVTNAAVTKSACVNCDVYLELWIIITVAGLLYSMLFLRALYRMRNKPDPFGNMREIKRVMIICGPLHVLGWILFAIDPGNVDYNRQFSWAWFQLLALVIELVLVVVIPTREAMKKIIFRTNSVSSENPAFSGNFAGVRLEDIIENPDLSAKFDKFAEERFAAESYRFLVDVVQWRKIYYEKSPHLVALKAKLIYERYIKPGALLEVNISDNVKQLTRDNLFDEQRNLRHTVSLEVFDRAVRETKGMVELGTWFEFLLSEDYVPGNKALSHAVGQEQSFRSVGQEISTRASDLSRTTTTLH